MLYKNHDNDDFDWIYTCKILDRILMKMFKSDYF